MTTETSETFDYANLLITKLENGTASNYSGRSNYGEHCLGFTYEDLRDYVKDALELVAYSQRLISSQETNELFGDNDLNTELLPDVEYLIDLLGSFVYDAMGRSSTIVYFPYRLKYPTNLIKKKEEEKEEKLET